MKRKLLFQTLELTPLSPETNNALPTHLISFFASAASKLMATLRSTLGHNQRDPTTSVRQCPPFNFVEISGEFVLSK